MGPVGRSLKVAFKSARESRSVSAPIAANLALGKPRCFEPPCDGTGRDPYLFGDGQLRVTLPAELDYQLISLIALLSAALAACFDQRQFLGLLDLARIAFGINELRSRFQLQLLDITLQRFAQIRLLTKW